MVHLQTMMMTTAIVNGRQYWKSALLYYLKISLWLSALGWLPALVVVLLHSIWVAVTDQRLMVSSLALEMGAIFGGFLFLLSFTTAIADDLYRNRGRSERILAMNLV
jgi:uncharacterized membrane protein